MTANLGVLMTGEFISKEIPSLNFDKDGINREAFDRLIYVLSNLDDRVVIKHWSLKYVDGEFNIRSQSHGLVGYILRDLWFIDRGIGNADDPKAIFGRYDIFDPLYWDEDIVVTPSEVIVEIMMRSYSSKMWPKWLIFAYKARKWVRQYLTKDVVVKHYPGAFK